MMRYSSQSTSLARTGSRRSRRVPAVGVIAVLLYLASPSLGQGVNMAMVRGVEEATAKLGDKFREIRSDILGADALAEEYRKVGFNYATLDVDKYLSTEVATTQINRVLNMIKNVTADSSSNDSISTECCEQTDSLQMCCEGCTQNPLLSAIAETISIDQSLEDSRVEIEFGHVDGSVMRYPPRCPQQHSHLQPWYQNMVRRKPLEIVLVVDLSDFVKSAENRAVLRSAAEAVLNSLTQQDKVQVVLVGKDVLKFEGDKKVLAVCTSHRNRMRTFIQFGDPGQTSIGLHGAYVAAFRAAFNSFSSVNSTNVDRLILFFTHALNLGTSELTTFNWALGNVTRLNEVQGDSVVISAYRKDDGGLIKPLQDLVAQPEPGVLKGLVSDDDVTDYYSVFNDVAAPVQYKTKLAERHNNSGGNALLSLSLALTNDSSLVGIFRVLFSWEMLFPEVGGLLERKSGGSHFFVVSDEGEVLYHPLVPGDFQSRVSVASLESQALLDRLQSSGDVEITVETTKEVFTAVSVRSNDRNSFISREVPVSYRCRRFSTVQLYACVVVSSEDMVTATLKNSGNANPFSSSSDGAPLYHTSTIPTEDKCSYFCTTSSKKSVSVQLTRPSQPPRDVGLPAIMQFLEENPSTTPSWAEEGVPNELGVVSVVGATWTTTGSSNESDFVVRRHLATPSGIYLSYPFARLDNNFVPLGTEWYILSAAHSHNDTITVTPPRSDALWGAGHVVSIGTTLSVPPQTDVDSEGGLLAVVAADLTLAALRTLVQDSLSICTTGDYNCFLLDDQGNLLYHELLFQSTIQELMDDPIFFVQQKANVLPAEFTDILSNMVNESVTTKLRCLDYLNDTVRQRLFLSINIDPNEVHAATVRGIEFAIGNIPGTNTFLGVSRRVRNIVSLFCFCTQNCQTCSENEMRGCECPCQCPEDCTTPHDYPACPLTELPNHNLVDDGETDSDVSESCLPLDCSCKAEQNGCEASRGCHWCSTYSICRHATECCSTLENKNTCCSRSPFTRYPSCISDICKNDDDIPEGECVVLPNTKNGSDTTASVVGGVLGALLVIILILIGAGFILWVRFFKKGLYEDDAKENNFDFSKSKPKAKNPLNEEQVRNDDAEIVQLEEKGGSDDFQNAADSGGDHTPV